MKGAAYFGDDTRSALVRTWLVFSARPRARITQTGALVDSQGPLAILWVGIGLVCFYLALIWLNMLLGFFLTPLFMVPGTWLMDIKRRLDERKQRRD